MSSVEINEHDVVVHHQEKKFIGKFGKKNKLSGSYKLPGDPVDPVEQSFMVNEVAILINETTILIN
jgi:hypothetical protein